MSKDVKEGRVVGVKRQAACQLRPAACSVPVHLFSEHGLKVATNCKLIDMMFPLAAEAVR